MQLCSCVYLHGFLSSGNSEKGAWLKRHLSTERHATESSASALSCHVLTPTYPQSRPGDSIVFLERFLQRYGLIEGSTPWCLIGSSLGGFYAQYLGLRYQVPYILINPALDPIALLADYAGPQRNPYTEELIHVDAAYGEALKPYYAKPVAQTHALLLVDKGDEVIDFNQAWSLYQNIQGAHQVMAFEGGNHAFAHLNEARADIEGFLLKAFNHAVQIR
jgi:hypothetical protein